MANDAGRGLPVASRSILGTYAKNWTDLRFSQAAFLLRSRRRRENAWPESIEQGVHNFAGIRLHYLLRRGKASQSQ